MLFASLWRIAYENQYLTHPLSIKLWINIFNKQLQHGYKKRAVKDVSKGKLEGLLESFMAAFCKKALVKFMKEGVTANHKVQTRRAINLLESFMTIFGKKQRYNLRRRVLQTMFKLLVVLFTIKLYARKDIFKSKNKKTESYQSYQKFYDYIW